LTFRFPEDEQDRLIYTIYGVKLVRGSNILAKLSETPQTASGIAFRSSKILDKPRVE